MGVESRRVNGSLEGQQVKVRKSTPSPRIAQRTGDARKESRRLVTMTLVCHLGMLGLT
jgi:hypothetical protein